MMTAAAEHVAPATGRARCPPIETRNTMPRHSTLSRPLPKARLRLLAASVATALLAACGGGADDLLGSQPSENAQGCPK